MDAQSLDQLEEKITRILSQINDLRGENQELKQQNQELRSKLEAREQTINMLNNEKEQLKVTQVDVESYKQNQDRIKSKVDSLLSKLKEFEEYQ